MADDSVTLFPLPSCLLDSIDEVLRNEARWLIKDMAKVLGVSPVPLIKQILDKKSSIYLYDNESDFQCTALIPQSNLLVVCRKPVILHSKLCDEHVNWKPSMKLPKTKLVRFQVPYDSTIPQLWLDKESGNVFNENMDVCGEYNLDTKVFKLFRISDTI